MRNGTEVNYNVFSGCGMKEEWLSNMTFTPKEQFRSYYKIGYLDKIDPKTFIIKMYKMLTTEYVFTITFEYVTERESSSSYNVCRPSIFINGEFIVGLNWCSNKWSALQQILIHFCNHEYSRLLYDQTHDNLINNKRESLVIFEEEIYE